MLIERPAAQPAAARAVPPGAGRLLRRRAVGVGAGALVLTTAAAGNLHHRPGHRMRARQPHRREVSATRCMSMSPATTACCCSPARRPAPKSRPTSRSRVRRAQRQVDQQRAGDRRPSAASAAAATTPTSPPRSRPASSMPTSSTQPRQGGDRGRHGVPARPRDPGRGQRRRGYRPHHRRRAEGGARVRDHRAPSRPSALDNKPAPAPEPKPAAAK
jgi:hypothetical protein